MLVYITAHGDPSVGIPSTDTEFELGLDEFEGREDREVVRTTLEDCFSEVWGETATVIFEDEFPPEEAA